MGKNPAQIIYKDILLFIKIQTTNKVILWIYAVKTLNYSPDNPITLNVYFINGIFVVYLD
jgi:hypothetical protein